jgi:hypothetical protein
MFDVRLPVEQKGDNLVPTLKKQDGRKSQQGPIFRTFLRGKFQGKFPPQKCWEKMEFSAEKGLKNRFSKKFYGIFRRK